MQEGEVDVAYRSLSPTDVDDLRGNDDVKVVDGPGGELRYVVFNFDTHAVRRQRPPRPTRPRLRPSARPSRRWSTARRSPTQVYKDTYTPAYSFVPDGFAGATTVLKDLYGDGNGGPDADKAKAILEAAGVTTPVALSLQYNSDDHYGPSSGDEYAMVKEQLEADGLFAVDLQSTEWVQYSKDRVADVYPAYQLGWFPDYSDADNYLTPFFLTNNFLGNHFSDPEVESSSSTRPSRADPAERQAKIEDIQAHVGELLSTVPLLQGAQVAVAGAGIDGVILDASFKFRYAPLTK